MGNLDAALKRYYRSIRKDLPCSYKMKKRVMQQIQESVDLFLEQNPDADFEAVQSHFGEPQTIALSYIEDQDAPELLRKMRIKKKLIAIVAGVMALILTIWLVALVWAVVDTKETNDGHINDTIIINNREKGYQYEISYSIAGNCYVVADWFGSCQGFGSNSE